MIPLAYAIASALAIAWTGVTIWALWSDRARGRRRCPKCFYEIDVASGLKCTECGREARSEKALGRTRRRWRVAVVAVVVLLVPALMAVGWARLVQTGGWPGVPTPITTRLLWLNNSAHDADVIERIRKGRLSRSDAERVVLAACQRLASDDPTRRSSGLDLLLTFFPGLSRLSSDAPDTRRAVLETIRPDRTMPVLIQLSNSDDPAEAAKAIRVMANLRDVSDDVLLAIVDKMGAEAGEVRSASRFAVMQHLGPAHGSRRFAPAPDVLIGGSDPASLRAVGKFTHNVRTLAHDRTALLQWLRDAALEDDLINDPEMVHRCLSVWLFCRLSEYDPAALDVVEAAMDALHEHVRTAATQQIQGFRWSPRVEQVLRGALRDSSARVHPQATRSAATFKHEAASLIPDLIDYAGRPDRNGGSSAFVEYFRAIGGDPKDLLPIVMARLIKEAEQRDEGGLGTRGRWFRETGFASIDWPWVSAMGVHDPTYADIAAKYVQRASYEPFALEACVAFAVLSGDRSATTTLVIGRNPSLDAAVNPQFPNPPLLRLVRMNYVEIDRFVEHYASSNDPTERAAVARLIVRYLSDEQLRSLGPLLDRLASDADPILVDAARQAAAKLVK